MIKDIETFMTLDSEREELKIIADTYAEFGEMAYDKAVMCYEDEDLIAYGVWMDLYETSVWYQDELNDDINKIKEKLRKIAGEA